MPGTASKADVVPAVIAVNSEVIEEVGRPEDVAAGMTLAGMVVVRRFERIVTYIVAE